MTKLSVRNLSAINRHVEQVRCLLSLIAPSAIGTLISSFVSDAWTLALARSEKSSGDTNSKQITQMASLCGTSSV